jgi:hypothetical protein
VRESGRGVVCAIEGLSECGFKDREVEGEWLEDDAPEKGGLEDWEWVWEWTWEVVDIASRDVVGRSRLPFDGPDVMLRVELAKHYLPSMLARDRLARRVRSGKTNGKQSRSEQHAKQRSTRLLHTLAPFVQSCLISTCL